MPVHPAAEIAIDEPLVRALLSAQASGVIPDAATLPLRRHSAGWDNEIWRLGDALAVRLPRRALAAPLVLHERAALPLLAPALSAAGVQTPVPVFAGASGQGFPWSWSIVPWFAGTRAMDQPRAERSKWAERLAHAVVALHTQAPADAPRNEFRGHPLVTRDATVRERIASGVAAGLLAAEDGTVLSEIWSEGVRTPVWSLPTVWLHGDLHPGNLLVTGADLSAILDFGDVTSGDPAYDLAASWLCFDAAGRERFISALGGRYDAATHARSCAWAAAISVLLLTHSDDSPAYAALGAETRDELIAAR